MGQRKANRRPLFMGASHSLRINKDYVGQAAVDWINEQENANQAICRAIDFYYRYFESGEYQNRVNCFQNDDPLLEIPNQISLEKGNLLEQADVVEQSVIDQDAMRSLTNMIMSVKR